MWRDTRFAFRHTQSSSGLRSNGRATAPTPRPPPLRGRAERCARVGHRRAALRCGLPHRVPRPSRPSLSSSTPARALRAVVASRYPTRCCESV
ncbi:hypothetical protein EVAR_91033_1 [Eumeta japonica]|uniref:Uncharacterized protein n=1 Tax=Eumeta variegata TaxID=151549 RepID=A0A4C1T348_EUMVA|nr:hypothetical protein EVAR_91033_1 [Eumeta japonica]